MYSELLALVRTVNEAEVLAQEAELLSEAIYSVSPAALEATLRESVRASASAAIRKSFGQEGVEKEKFLKGLVTELKKLKTLELTLAFEPTDAVISNFYDWVKENIGEGIILDITFQKSILGGVIVTYQGKYGDFSLRKKLKQEFEKDKVQLTSKRQ